MKVSASRISIYLIETFQVYSRLLLSVLACVIAYLYQSKSVNNEIPIDLFLITTISMFMSLLYYRVCDEFKDEDTDKKYFPERPFPSGRVKGTDLKFLLYLSAFGILSINLLQISTYLYGVMLFTYCVLMQKWFFMPNLLENNRLLAFLTHSPYAIALNIFIIAVFVNGDTQQLYSIQNICLIACLSLPGFHWEIIRKTFTSEREGYETYSHILGYSKSIYFSLVYIVITIIASYWVLNKVFFITNFILCALYTIYLVLLAITKKESKFALRTLAEVISSAIMIILLINGILS